MYWYRIIPPLAHLKLLLWVVVWLCLNAVTNHHIASLGWASCWIQLIDIWPGVILMHSGDVPTGRVLWCITPLVARGVSMSLMQPSSCSCLWNYAALGSISCWDSPLIDGSNKFGAVLSTLRQVLSHCCRWDCLPFGSCCHIAEADEVLALCDHLFSLVHVFGPSLLARSELIARGHCSFLLIDLVVQILNLNSA